MGGMKILGEGFTHKNRYKIYPTDKISIKRVSPTEKIYRKIYDFSKRWPFLDYDAIFNKNLRFL
jgi:hypothetical protein